MFKIFARKAAPEGRPPETAVLNTKHGQINMSRVQVANAVAYVCHTSRQAADAILDVKRVEFVPIDRNNGPGNDPNNVMSEVSSYGDNDYLGAAERVCDSTALMEKAVVVVFFDHIGDKSGNASDVLKAVRNKFPATDPALDCLEPPHAASRPRLRLVESTKPPGPKNHHYSC